MLRSPEVLLIYLYREGKRTQRIDSPKDEVVFGTTGDVVLQGPKIAARHCRLDVRPAGCFLVKEQGAVHVNGKPLEKATPLYATDKVFVGDYTFMIEWVSRALDPKEEKLLADITCGDAESRMVYADWLEENGDARRAELLRLQEALAVVDDHVQRAELVRRLRHIATLVDAEWRMRVARAPVEGCRIQVPCNQQWSECEETGHVEIRQCDQCKQQVFYCTSVAEARKHAWNGRRVAVDITSERVPRDLEPPPRYR